MFAQEGIIKQGPVFFCITNYHKTSLKLKESRQRVHVHRT